jgi:hypothetical protein
MMESYELRGTQVHFESESGKSDIRENIKKTTYETKICDRHNSIDFATRL